MTDTGAIDLFCGAGGLSEGFRQAGFRILAGNDNDPFAVETFRSSHTESPVLAGPIEDFTAPDFLRVSGLTRGELDCLVGGPPCQAFSVYNHQRGLHDRRSGLFREYLRIVEGLMPKWVVMENVTGIMSAGDGQAVDHIICGLGKLGYDVEMRILRGGLWAYLKSGGASSSSAIDWVYRTVGLHQRMDPAFVRSPPSGMLSGIFHHSRTARFRSSPSHMKHPHRPTIRHAFGAT